MRAILIIGWKNAKSAPEGLFCGNDGVKANTVASKAQESGKFFALRRIDNVETVGRPLPTVPVKKAAQPSTPPAPPVPPAPPAPPEQVAPEQTQTSAT